MKVAAIGPRSLSCPAVSRPATLEELKENAKDAIETHLGALALTGDDLPEPVYTKIDIEVDFESIIAAAKSEITR